MNKNILKRFSGTFVDAVDMWDKLSVEYDEMEKRDPEFHGGLVQLAGAIEKFNDASEIVSRPEGINIEEALKIVEGKKTDSDQNYPFVLFVILKNLEHTGMVKMFNRPERIAKSAMAAYGKKRAVKK